MTPPTHQAQVLGTARADHEILTGVMENVRAMFKGERPADAAQQFANIQQLLAVKIGEHFADEEKYLFPWMVTDNPSAAVAQVVAELCREHATLLEEAQQLRSLLHHRSITNCSGALWVALLDFFCDLHAHAAKEDQLFKLFT